MGTSCGKKKNIEEDENEKFLKRFESEKWKTTKRVFGLKKKNPDTDIHGLINMETFEWKIILSDQWEEKSDDKANYIFCEVSIPE